MTTIHHRLQEILLAIDTAKKRFDAPQNVALLAVSKAQTAEKMREVALAGQVAFGENYLQEAIDKQATLADLNLSWHFIGPIQSNKTQLIAKHFDWVHGVDRLKIAQRLHDARPETALPLQICIQVNVSNEPSKSGVSLAEAATLADEIKQLPRLNLRGLMAIPAPTKDVTLQHRQFKAVRDCFETLNENGLGLDTLSMGMSEDYAIAIAEGATIVRIGSALFGQRLQR